MSAAQSYTERTMLNLLHARYSKPGIYRVYRVNGSRHGYSRISDTFARDGKLSQ